MLLFGQYLLSFHGRLQGYTLGASLGNTIGFWFGMGSAYHTYSRQQPETPLYLLWCASPYVATQIGTSMGSYRLAQLTTTSRMIEQLFHKAPLRHFYLNLGFFAINATKSLFHHRQAEENNNSLAEPKALL